MLRSLNFRNILIALFFVLFFTYLREQLIVDAMRKFTDISSPLIPWCVLGMITIIGIYVFFQRKVILGFGGVPKYFRDMLVFTFAISTVWSLFIPFTSLNTYLLLALPTFIVWFSYNIVYTQESENFLLFFLVLGLLVLTKSFYDTIEYRLLLGAREDSQVNTSYYILYLAPLFLCSKRMVVRISSLILIFIIVLTSAKRGGTIAISISTLAYLFTNYVLVKKDANLFRNLFIVLLIVLIGGHYLVEYLESSDFTVISRLIQTAEDGGHEVRSEIWATTLDMILSSNILQLLLGHGYNAVLADNILGFSAHNDFLEIAYDYGIIALILYIVFVYKIFEFCKELIKEESRYAGAMVFSFCLFIVNSMVSHIYIYPFYASIFALVWGAIYALYKKEELSTLS